MHQVRYRQYLAVLTLRFLSFMASQLLLDFGESPDYVSLLFPCPEGYRVSIEYTIDLTNILDDTILYMYLKKTP